MIIGIILVFGGISLFSYSKYTVALKKANAIELEKSFEKPKTNTLNLNRKEEMALITEKGDPIIDSAIGVIRIDTLDVVLPIYDKVNEKIMLSGVGVLEDTDLPSSQENTITVLAGHRNVIKGINFFRDIDKLQAGDEIKITMPKEILYYQVLEQEIIDPYDWSKFTREKNKTKLMLLSCHPYPENHQRLLVKAKLKRHVYNEQLIQ
ncbi:sortase srtC1 [Streptococcus equi subsp. zooepidemicus SzS31A1]|uniref:Sortase srtC1 n=2 Tax=Streptococcus equi TaxID=1336 RepID=A0ABN0MWP3_STRSZ|nr:sortase srtC1 [Streptococcus equi subsp. zooepidemicus SzS31A1]